MLDTCKNELIGASNVKPVLNVPAVAPTVTVSTFVIRATPPHRHARVVAEFQPTELQPRFEIEKLAERSLTPKLRPVTVIDAAPVDGRFFMLFDKTGASNVNPSTNVPTTEATVTPSVILSASSTADLQPTLEWDVHVAVEHDPDARTVDAVKSIAPKLSPVTVTDAAPDCGAFRNV
jgi:hypothetical protein